MIYFKRKCRHILLFVLLFYFGSFNTYGQVGYVILDSTSTVLLKSYTDTNSNQIKSFVTIHNCYQNTRFCIFSLKNNILHGMYYLFSTDGVALNTYEFKDGLLWNIFLDSDSLYRGEMINGTGFINNYISSKYWNESYDEKHFLASREYFIDGLPYRIIGFRKSGEISDYSNISNVKAEFRNDSLVWSCRNPENSIGYDESNVVLYYTKFKYDEDTIFYLNRGLFVVAYTLEGASDFFYKLLPEDYFIPEFLQNKYNLKKFKKLKKKLIKAYSECNGVAECYFPEMEKYYKKYFKEK